MFYKQKLNMMGQVYKEHLNNACSKWQEEISQKGEARINITEEFESILGHTINHICFGEDHEDDTFDFLIYNVDSDSFSKQKVTLRKAMHNLSKQAFTKYTKKLSNPISGFLKILFDIDVEIGSYHKTVEQNSRSLYNHMNKYVQARKQGLTKSKMEGHDLLSAFLEDQKFWSDEHLIETLLGFIFAAIETTALVSQTLISFLTNHKEALTKVR